MGVHYEVLRFAVFFNEKLHLSLFCLLAILDSAKAGVSYRDSAESRLTTSKADLFQSGNSLISAQMLLLQKCILFE